MRLKNNEIQAIKTTFNAIFKHGAIYLFGSRVDDTKKGGDIDLYISTPDKKDLVSKKIDFLVGLKRKIGEQKIDVVLDYKDNRLIDKIAKQGIRL
jgi:predicted nucleotidyltransferase